MTMRRGIGGIVLIFLASAIAGCGGGSGSGSGTTPSISIAFQTAPPQSLQVGKTASLAAVVTNDSSDAGVNWSCTPANSCGSFNPTHTASGNTTTYTAPSEPPSGGSVAITATSVANSAVFVSADVAITLPILVSFDPTPPSALQVNATPPITAVVSNDSSNKGVNWACSPSNACGSFDPAHTASGSATTYTAPASVPAGGSVTITATSAADSSAYAPANILITTLPISVSFNPTPPSALQLNGTSPITAVVSNDPLNKGVNWKCTAAGPCGSFNPTHTASGSATTYTAPATAPQGGIVTITATSAADPLDYASANILIKIPGSYWGFHVNSLSSYPLQLPYGQFRSWDSAQANWPYLETCQAQSGNPNDPCFAWTNLDNELADLYQQGITDIFYTLSRTPYWASQDPNDSTCAYSQENEPKTYGECWPPNDLNPDGTGKNQIWRNWVAAVASRVNDRTYLQTHAHVKYWEPWNEFDQDASWKGTNNELVRLAEDMNCIVTGQVTTIMANGGETCQHALSTVGLASAIDLTSMITTPSTAGTDAPALESFLYCMNDPKCTEGDAGAAAVDIIDVHLHADTETPEYIAGHAIPTLEANLQPAEQQKPVWDGEGSWGKTSNSDNMWQDPYAQAGFIPRYFALLWNVGVTEIFWYGYDFTDIGQLFDPSSGLIQPQATAWTVTYNWLNGATAGQPFCTADGSIYSCDFTEANGTIASLVWNANDGEDCSSDNVPIICGDTAYTVPAQFNKDWIDLSGTVHGAASSVTIGSNPILLEGQ